MIIGGYTLHMYCDNSSCRRMTDDGSFQCKWEGPDEYYGNTDKGAFADARQAGWKFDRKEYVAICLHCANRGISIRLIAKEKKDGRTKQIENAATA